MNDNEIRIQTKNTVEEVLRKAFLKKGDILVIGCSTSEVVGSAIGTNSSPETAKLLFETIYGYTCENGIYLAAQCCEHLNRAIIVEREAVPFAQPVNAVPQPKAGGSFATQAYAHFKNPVALEEISADAGIDIGSTLIGMHLKKVAVPIKLQNNKIGGAVVVAARTRPKFVGGVRTAYDENLL